MPVDKNEAPEGHEAVESIFGCKGCHVGNNPHTCPKNNVVPVTVFCGSFHRKDKTSVIFIKKERLEKTMEEYEYMTANTLEAWRTIVDAIFRGDCEIKRSVVKPEGTRGIAVSVVWDRATHIENGREYRWKKPAPPKVKQLVDRTAEDFWPLIGRYWAKDSAGRRYLILNDTWHSCAIQECWQIAPLGTEEWQPMQKEIEVES